MAEELNLQERIIYAMIVEHNMYAEEIAEKLNYSISSAKMYIHNILKKTGEKTCRDLIFKYYNLKAMLNEQSEHHKIVRLVDNM